MLISVNKNKIKLSGLISGIKMFYKKNDFVAAIKEI